MKKGILYIFAISLFFYSCSKEEEEMTPTVNDDLVITFNATANGEALEFKKEFDDPLMRKMYVEMFRTYISNIYLLNGTTETKILDVALITFENNGELDPNDLKQKITIEDAPLGSYTGIKLGIGLDANLNNMDPTSFPDDHPLSIQQGTYWTTWDKYRFLMIEGKIDGDNDGQITDLFGFHTGFDVCYRERTYTKDISIAKGKLNSIEFNIEINDLFFGNDTLDIVTEPTWHGDTIQIHRAYIISDNAIDALTYKE